MTLRRAISLLMETAALKLAGSGCGLPGGVVLSPGRTDEVVKAIRRAHKYLYGREMTRSEAFNLQIPMEYWSDAA